MLVAAAALAVARPARAPGPAATTTPDRARLPPCRVALAGTAWLGQPAAAPAPPPTPRPSAPLPGCRPSSTFEAAERDQLLQRFWNQALHQTPEADAEWFHTAGTPSMPAEPTAEQIDAWLELAALAADPDFQRVTQAPARWFTHHARPDLDMAMWQEQLHHPLSLATQARDRGADPKPPPHSPGGCTSS